MTSWDEEVANNLNEPSYDVEVKVSDLNSDTDNPLSSAKTFEDLNLSVLLLVVHHSLAVAVADNSTAPRASTRASSP